MSTNALRAATNAAKEPQSFPELLDRMKPEIARALPRHLNPERMTRIALTEYRKNPKLGECNIRSIFGAIITLSQLGLEPGVLGAAYLIPYKGECTAVPGWKGLTDLVSRAGRASVWTGAVYAGDHFEYGLGTNPFITHKPRESGEVDDIKDLRYCYAVGRIKGAEWPIIEVWSVAKIKAHRDRFNKVGNRHYSYQHFEMYGRKVPLLQVIKYMPASVELQVALDLENASNAGQTIDMTAAADGSWVPPPDPDEGGGGDEPGAGSASAGASSGGNRPDPATWVATLNGQQKVADLTKAWASCKEAFGGNPPNECDAAYQTRMEVLGELEGKQSDL